jgi:hypothetical protein
VCLLIYKKLDSKDKLLVGCLLFGSTKRKRKKKCGVRSGNLTNKNEKLRKQKAKREQNRN